MSRYEPFAAGTRVAGGAPPTIAAPLSLVIPRSRERRGAKWVAAVASIALAPLAAGQGVVEAYWVNDGVNDAHDVSFGEFGPDLGGTIYFERYGNVSPLNGHLYARSWIPPPPTFPTFKEYMFERLMDFDHLVANLSPSVVPVVVLDPRAYGNPGPQPPPPMRALAWWKNSGGAYQEILYWPYKINGGSMMICMGGNGAGQPIGGVQKSLLVYNYYNHPSAFGTNKNRYDDTNPDGWAREFSRVPSFNNAPFAESFFEGTSSAQPWLGPKEQAIAAGDIVVIVQENYGMAIATALARTQEAVWWARNVFAAAVPGISPPTAFTIEGAYLHGVSFGAAMAGFVALAQPQYYRGVVDWITSDLGFELGDFSELQWHFSAGIDNGPFQATTDNFFPDIYAFVDQLGIRFDRPVPPQTGWDLAAFSLNRRPLDVKIPIRGHIGEHERQFPGSWCVNDPALFASSASSSMTRYRNRAHEEAFGVVPTVNEYAIFDGTEWATAKNSNPPASFNRIVPLSPAPLKPYPDPYNHTLRPPPSGPFGGNVLTQLDARDGMDGSDAYHGDGYRHPVGPPAVHPIKSIGHGIYPGYRDQMRVADLDNDGRMEVVFGNLDGYVHILEFAGSVGNPADPYRLIDEWQSPRLGLGVFACDAMFNGGLATMFFADSRGQIWKISATGPNSYSMGTPAPLVSPATANQFIYDGSTPTLLVADFDGGVAGAEVIVMNRFFDWSLFRASNGAPVGSLVDGRMQRSTRINGPTDAFVIESSDGDSPKEILLSSTNGGVWLLNRSADATGTWIWKTPEPVIAPSTCSRDKVVPCYFNGGTVPSHLLSFCTDDDRYDAPPPPGAASGPGIIELFEISFNPIVVTKKAETDGGADSFAWIDKPKASSSTAMFATNGGNNRVSTYWINLAAAGGPGVVQLNSIDLALVDREPEGKFSDRVTSLDCALLQGPSGPPAKQLVYCTSKGRIHVISTDLDPGTLRDSSQEFSSGFSPVPPTENPYEAWRLWPSSRSLSQAAACDLVQPRDSSGVLIPHQGNFYFAEYTVPAFRQENSGGFDRPRYRVGRIGIGTAAGGKNEWEPFVARPESGIDWEGLAPQWTRALSVDDFINATTGAITPDGNLEFRVFTETGVAFVDPDVGDGEFPVPGVREFQTSSNMPKSLGGADKWIAAQSLEYTSRQQFGGRVFEVLSNRRKGDYWHLSFMSPPPDPTNYFFDNGGGASRASGWWYPRVGSAIVDDQISSNCQSAHELSLGTSMKIGMIRTSSMATETTAHVIVGITCGYVYAIEPLGVRPVPNQLGGITSELRHLSTHLGTFVIGLDADDLDGDESNGDVDDEIVCGTWLDTGTFTDWNQTPPDLSKNRAHLYILDPNVLASGPAFLTQAEVLDGDDLAGPGLGISSGVTGVKIDDVDGDGDSEIWCSDATGYLYLFAKDDSEVWHCVYRSDDLCAYPGFYNNLHPIKGEDGETMKLAVQSPGYFFVFAVDSDAITADWWNQP